MNGKRVEIQKSVKTCSEKLTKQPQKKELGTYVGGFWHYFSTIFGYFWGSWRPPKSEFQRESLLLQLLVDFGSLLGPLLGAMLRQNGLPKLSKVIFSRIFHPSEKHTFLENFLRSLWDPLGTVLGPFWVHFGKVLETTNRCQHRP